MKGCSMHHVGGRDRHISTDPVIYSQPIDRPRGLDWDAIRNSTPPVKEPAMTEAPPEPADDVDAVTIPNEDLPALVLGEDYYPVPDYVADMTRVLLASENHTDQQVRDIRKIAVQAIATLHRMGVLEDAADEPPAGSLEEVLGDLLPKAVPVAGAPLDPRAVRNWCATEGIEVNAMGRIPVHIQDLYRKAHAA